MKRRRRTRKNKENEDNKDMLSDLPDSVLIHILSFLITKHAVQTCLLSTRWKHLWKCIPTLTISFDHFSTYESFTQFVSQVLSLRDDASTALHTLNFHLSYRYRYTRREDNLTWRVSYRVDRELLQRMIRYAVSHNVNRLRLSSDIRRFQLTYYEFPNSLNLPALTYLELHDISFCSTNDSRIELFSTLKNLNTLILSDCTIPDAQIPFCISNTKLLNLSINSHSGYQLELVMPFLISKLELSTPNLCSFTFTGKHIPKLYGSSLDSIKKARIDVYMDMMEPSNHLADALVILLNWLIELVDIKSLTVSTATLQVLSLFPDILKVKPPSWNNLKSLKVKRYQNRYLLSMIR